MAMRMELGLYQKLEQRMILAPQMIMSMEILQLPALDLQALIKQNLNENPVLELEEGGTDSGAADGEGGAQSAEAQAQEAARKSDADFEATMKRMEAVENSWRDYFEATGGHRASGMDDDRDPKWEAMNNTAARSVSLQDYLINQINFAEFGESSGAARPGRRHMIVTYLIYNIDKNGYLQHSLEDMVATINQRARQVARNSDDGNQRARQVQRSTADSLPETDDATPPAVLNRFSELTSGHGDIARGQESNGHGGNGHRNGNGRLALPMLGLLRDGEIRGLVLEEPVHGGDREPALNELLDRIVLSVDDEEYMEFAERPLQIAEAVEALEVVQSLDPPGVGARDLKECLLLQLGKGKNDPRYAFERRMVNEFLEDIRANRLMKIAKETGESIDLVKDAVAFLTHHLNPKPGNLYSSEEVQYITPDVVVEQVDGRYEIRLEDSYIPRIAISPYYRQLLAEQKDDPKLRDYIKKKIESAKWLLDAIGQRQSTLSRIANEIVDVQQGFFDHGLEYLRPLKMQDIADRVSVHVSTVCRAVADKYIQTPRGIFPLKFFFTGGTTSSDGQETSTLAVKEKIRWLVDKEDKSSPLSDDEIADKLKDQHGLSIARRTVTKYRKQLHIASSRERKEF